MATTVPEGESTRKTSTRSVILTPLHRLDELSEEELKHVEMSNLRSSDTCRQSKSSRIGQEEEGKQEHPLPFIVPLVLKVTGVIPFNKSSPLCMFYMWATRAAVFGRYVGWTMEINGYVGVNFLQSFLFISLIVSLNQSQCS